MSQESPSEAVIQRDLNRTFPAHEFFRDTGGEGQDALYRISKVGGDILIGWLPPSCIVKLRHC